MRNRFALVLSVLALFCCLVSCKPEPKFYNVTFNSNGAEGVGPDAVVVAEGSSMNLPSECGLAKDGYYFAGWSTTADGSGTMLKAGERIEVMSDIIFYAKWILPSCKVTFDPNGAKGKGPDAFVVVEGSSMDIPSECGLAKDGYYFAGWTRNADGSGTVLKVGERIEVLSDIIFYAKWSRPFYNVTFNSNGAEGVGPDAVVVAEGSSMNLPSECGLTKDGYFFAGWSKAPDLVSTVLKAGERIEVMSDIVFYAMWNRSSYNVKFNANGAIGDVPDSSMVNAGGYFTVPSQGKLSMEGYVFDGWNTQANGEGVSYAENRFVEGVYADIELYAQWKKLHTITLDANKGDGTPSSAVKVVDGGSYTVPSCGFLPAKDKVFSGWSTVENGAGKIFYEGNEIDPVTADLTLYAVWKDDPLEYEFDANSCSWIVKGFKDDVGDEDKRNVVIPALRYDGNPVMSIGDSAFKSCENIESILIPDGLENIGDFAFYSCSNLESIVIPNGVRSIGETAFYGCILIEEIVIPDSVRSIGASAFKGCNLLKEIVIPASVTSIGDSVFAFCNKLASIKVDSGNRAYYVEGNCLMEKASKKLVRGCVGSIVPADTKIIGPNAFSGLVSLTQIGIPEGVESICYEAFSGCVELEEAIIPSSVTSLEMYAFATCKKLVEIIIPSKVTSIGLAAFSDCSNLKEVLISEGVGSIGDHAFSGCTNLEKITIPSSMTSIDSFALYVIDPEATLNIFYGGSRSVWENLFSGSLHLSSTAKVHCSDDPQV